MGVVSILLEGGKWGSWIWDGVTVFRWFDGDGVGVGLCRVEKVWSWGVDQSLLLFR